MFRRQRTANKDNVVCLQSSALTKATFNVHARAASFKMTYVICAVGVKIKMLKYKSINNVKER